MFRLDDQQGKRLTQIMLAIRPDWTNNHPGTMLREVNEGMGFLHASDFEHMIRAVAHYATLRDENGRHHYRAPDIYPRDGEHWTLTAPKGFEKPKGSPCEDHSWLEADTCRCCWADVKAGLRPRDAVGMHWAPPDTEPEPNEPPEASADAGAFPLPGTDEEPW